jgi:hypothetical protein
MIYCDQGTNFPLKGSTTNSVSEPMTPTMTIDEVVRDIPALEADLENYERKYGILSETFYEAYQSGEEPADDAWTLDWSDWSGAYEIRERRRQEY